MVERLDDDATEHSLGAWLWVEAFDWDLEKGNSSSEASGQGAKPSVLLIVEGPACILSSAGNTPSALALSGNADLDEKDGTFQSGDVCGVLDEEDDELPVDVPDVLLLFESDREK